MIAVLTYNNPHRKTQDVLFQLVAKGHTDIKVFASPWKARKNFLPIFKHRPGEAVDVMPETLCKRLNIEFQEIETEALEQEFQKGQFQHHIIAGAGILPEGIVNNYKLINSHPAYLPYVKGLDALKWAIYQGHPVGVTLHYVSAETDQGDLIHQVEVPLYYEDTFHAFAYRQYEIEIDLLTSAPELIAAAEAFPSLADEVYPANRRMPHHVEMKMMDAFDRLREKAPSIKELD